VETVGHLCQGDDVVGQAERRARRRREEECEAPCLEPPELVVVEQVGDVLLDLLDVYLRGARLPQLTHRLGGEVLQLDALGVAVRPRLRRQIDRDARRIASGEQPFHLSTRRYVGVEVHR
jgi:hypothetical protein